MSTEHLVEAAREAAVAAYAPYSEFRVGAVVVDVDGNEYTGANVENAAYGSTLCAEAVAIGVAVSSGARKLDILAVACVDAADVEGAYPCGNCRQLMNEFGVETVIVTAGEGADIRQHTLDELNPYGFTL